MKQHKYRMLCRMMAALGYAQYINEIPRRYVDELPDGFWTNSIPACLVLKGLLFDFVPALYQEMK